jgi:hypothetical protein
MARVTINLASEPFRRDRALLVASVAMAALLVVSLGGLVTLVLSERARAAETREMLAKLEVTMRAQGAEQARYDAVLRQAQNSEVLDRNVFLNTLIGKK